MTTIRNEEVPSSTCLCLQSQNTHQEGGGVHWISSGIAFYLFKSGSLCVCEACCQLGQQSHEIYLRFPVPRASKPNFYEVTVYLYFHLYLLRHFLDCTSLHGWVYFFNYIPPFMFSAFIQWWTPKVTMYLGCYH